MKIIDKTPFQNPQGEVDLSGRIQGTLKYGFDWYGELQVQKTVIAQLERLLEKGFVLIRNFTLPEIDVIIPIILIGPGGIYVIHVTNAKGQFEARGDQWDNVVNDRPMPARTNLLVKAAKYARALQIYLTQQKIQTAVPIEPILIAANPGAHVDSLRPIARVVMSDAIKQFAASLAQARPMWRTDNVHDVADRIINPRPVDAQAPQPTSRAAAVPEAAENADAFNPADLDFAFEEGQPPAPQGTPSVRETSPAQPLPRRAAPQKRRVLGMTAPQVAFLAAMFIVECCVLIGFGAFYYFFNQ